MCAPWIEIMDMPGEIFDLDIDDREMMPPDMQEDIEKEDPLLDDWWSFRSPTFRSIVHLTTQIGLSKINSKPKKCCPILTLVVCGKQTAKKT